MASEKLAGPHGSGIGKNNDPLVESSKELRDLESPSNFDDLEMDEAEKARILRKVRLG